MIITAYFFLLVPSEYTASKSESTPFCLEDTTFSCGHIIFAATVTDGDLQAANFITLTFTTQKKNVRGGGLGHMSLGDPLLCPKAALI